MKLCFLNRSHHSRERNRKPVSNREITGKSRKGKTGGASARRFSRRRRRAVFEDTTRQDANVSHITGKRDYRRTGSPFIKALQACQINAALKRRGSPRLQVLLTVGFVSQACRDLPVSVL